MRTGRIGGADLESLTYHGGALDVAERLTPDAPRPWIDLSTGINPRPYPLVDLPGDVWTRLPSRAGLAALEAAAAERYGARTASVAAGPGSQALLQTLARLVSRGPVGALGPTYGGYADAFEPAGHAYREVSSLSALAECAVAIVANPNNPDGRRFRSGELLDLHADLARRGGRLIVDEAFIDFDAGESLAPVLPERDAVVLRSFGKTYGLAGLRLGFAVASPDLSAPLRAALGSWPVSGPAIAIGAQALADSAWLAAARAGLERDAARLDALFVADGWRVVGGALLFRLYERADAKAAFRRLLEAGVLVRPFAARPDWLRLGIPAGEGEWRRLEAALGA